MYKQKSEQCFLNIDIFIIILYNTLIRVVFNHIYIL